MEQENQKNAKWYILHTYSGYESMVQENLHMVFAKNNMSDRLLEVLVPLEDVVEEKNGKRKVVQRKKFPTYVIVKMVYDNKMWHMVTNTRGVTGFVGPMGRPIALTEAEIKRMRLEPELLVETDIAIGAQIKVVEGALAGFVGIIEEVNLPASKCKALVSMFGKDTSVELELNQIEKIL